MPCRVQIKSRNHHQPDLSPVAKLQPNAVSNLMISVAIVEDNETVRQTLNELIEATPGFRCVCTCATGKEALLEIPRAKPDVVLMDIHLPGESGIVCTARLKERLPDLQVIILTVYKDIELRSEERRVGKEC